MAIGNENDFENWKKSTYYYDAANKKQIPLVREPRVFAVRYRSGRNLNDSNFSPDAISLLNDNSKNIGFISNYGLQLYQINPDVISKRTDPEEKLQDVIAKVKKLSVEDPVDYAAVAYLRNPDKPSTSVGDLMFVTCEFMVQFKSQITLEEIEAFNAKYGVHIIKEIGYAENGYLLEAPEAEGEYGPVVLSNIYYESGIAIFAHPNFIRQRHLREISKLIMGEYAASIVSEKIDQPVYLSLQWHLRTAKVVDAWNITRGSTDINITILDDGIDTGHREFTDKVLAQHDFASGIDDANPKISDDKHGTACAGVAVAKGIRASGAAPNCSLIAGRCPDFLGSEAEGEMFQWAKDHGSDIISCSWGPEDGIGSVDPLPDNVRAAIHYCVTQGRSGRGIPIFWAAGNGNELVSNDGYASNPEVMAVAASSNNEHRSPYSDFGPEIFISAPSSGSKALGEMRIFTVDCRGSDGYNPDSKGTSHPTNDLDYTDDFGGTSSAAPLVAGIAGLMLSVNPNLRVQDVRQILRDTADKIDQSNGNYDNNGHSDYYGYGRVNALRAVEMSRDLNLGTTTDTEPGEPSITGPSSINRDSQPPTFQINIGGRHLYAVEVATRAELFNRDAHRSERNSNNFFASWTKGLESITPYNLPTDVWDRLKSAAQLFYRLHVADDNSWFNYAVTVDDNNADDAPSIKITAVSGGLSTLAEPSITGPSSINRDSQPPTFQINMGGRHLYAVEVTTRAELFNRDAHRSERNSNNFFASWTKGLESITPYNLPTDVWDRLKSAAQLFYRLHVADDNSWFNYAVTVDDNNADNAPSIQIMSDITHSQRTVIFPSGATFEVIYKPLDDIDYSDPVGNGRVPLIEVGDRMQENISRNIKVKELATDDLRYARISPELVEGLQRIRDRVGSDIIVFSGYRDNALNEAVEGDDKSQHITGRAADISASTKSPLDLARIALEELGCDIGIGLGCNSIHIDLRGQLTSWCYKGAELNENDFYHWIRDICRQLGLQYSKRMEYIERVAPKIIGPEIYNANYEAPTFYIELGPYSYYSVEIATNLDLFNRQSEVERNPNNFYDSWDVEGLREAHGAITYTLPKDVWERLRNKNHLYYRIVTSSTDTREESSMLYSTPDKQLADAPWIELTSSRKKKRESDLLPFDLHATRINDEDLWRK